MAQIRKDRTPAYKQIQNAIIKRIESGELNCGDPVDSERVLAKIHGVSLMTARHALSALEREGIVERRTGVGTFVAPPRIHFNKLMSFTEQMAERGLAADSRVLSVEILENELEIAARLALPPGDRLLKIERLRLGAKEPFSLQTSYLSAKKFAGLNKQVLERASLFTLLEREYGVQIAYADGEIDATSADTRAAKLLSIAKGDPLLRIRQTAYSTQGPPLLYGFGLYRADRHLLNIRRFRQSGKPLA
jgi:GntR family transcriptional regulator